MINQTTKIDRNTPRENTSLAGDKAPGLEQPEVKGARALSLTGNFVWTFGGNAVYALCQWAAIICLAKIGSVEMVGVFALALAVTNPITFLANLQLRVLYVTDQKSKYPFSEILGLRLALAIVAFMIMLAVCRIAGYSKNTTAVILLVGIAFLIDSLSENYYAIAQRVERMDRIAMSQMLRGVLAVLSLGIIVYYTGNLAWAALGLVVGRLLVFLSFDSAPKTFALEGRTGPEHAGGFTQKQMSFWGRILPAWNWRNQVNMLWVAIPLGIASILVSLNVNMPRYFIDHYRGAHELGIFSALTYIPTAVIMVATALGYAVFAQLSRLYSQGQTREFKKLMLKTAAFCGGIGVVTLLISAVAGYRILLVLYKPEYAEHLQLLLWLVSWGAMGAVAACMGYAMTATSHFREQVPLFCGVTLVSIISCFFLVPRFGGLGGAFGALLGMGVQLLGTLFVIYRALRQRSREAQSSSKARQSRMDVVSSVSVETP